jgi:hypothetical protein
MQAATRRSFGHHATCMERTEGLGEDKSARATGQAGHHHRQAGRLSILSLSRWSTRYCGSVVLIVAGEATTA